MRRFEFFWKSGSPRKARTSELSFNIYFVPLSSNLLEKSEENITWKFFHFWTFKNFLKIRVESWELFNMGRNHFFEKKWKFQVLFFVSMGSPLCIKSYIAWTFQLSNFLETSWTLFYQLFWNLFDLNWKIFFACHFRIMLNIVRDRVVTASKRNVFQPYLKFIKYRSFLKF